jgi:hypothetical protein
MAAVGFVWNPLPSFLAVPFLWPWFPWMFSKGFAGNIVSAAAERPPPVCSHASSQWGLNRWVRWALVITFALHPMIFYAGANGMSEAPYLLFLMLACRYLARWLRTRSTADLVACGVALGVGYFVRYEVLAAGLAVGGLVLVSRFVWTGGGFRLRMREAVADFGIVIAPIVFAFVAWALASWIIVGSAFEQFTSQYGNAAQLAVGRGTTGPQLRRGRLNHAFALLLLSVAFPSP